MTTLDRQYSILQKPVLTEKSTREREDHNAYHFRVPLTANKVEIRQAVEKLFEVKVVAVNTLRVRGKWRRRGYTSGTAPAWKRAMVILRPGDTIEIL